MILLVLSGMAMAAATAQPAPTSTAAPFHQATVQHGTLPVEATYRMHWKTTMRDVNPTPVMRQGLPACRWQASVAVNRDVQSSARTQVAALTKPIHQFEPMSGFEMGQCAQVKGRIESKIAQRSQGLEVHATAAAQRDHAVLMTELDTITALTRSTDG